jgi:hypothetical protein
LFVHGQWFSLGIPASSITKSGCHDIAEILLKVVLNTINQIKPNQIIVQTCSPSNIADFFLIKILKPSDQTSLYVKARVMSAELEQDQPWVHTGDEWRDSIT